AFAAALIQKRRRTSRNASKRVIVDPDLLVHEASSVVTGLDGAKLAFNRCEPRQDGYVAAALSLQRALPDILRKFMSATEPRKQLLHLVFRGELTQWAASSARTPPSSTSSASIPITRSLRGPERPGCMALTA